MTNLGRIRLTAAAVAAALAAAACTGGPSGVDLAPIATGTPVPASAPEEHDEQTPSPVQLAEENAAAVLMAFHQLFDELYADPARDLHELSTVADDRALDWATEYLARERSMGRTSVGRQVLDQVTITEVFLEPEDTAGGYPAVRLSTCIDLTNFDVLDEDGSSVVLPQRPARISIDWAIWNIGLPGDDQWVVAETSWISDSPEVETC